MLMALKELVFAFLAGVIPMLPGPLKWFLDLAGITKMLESSLNRQQDYESRAKANLERKRKQTQIEKNRPESPNKKERISFETAPKDKKTTDITKSSDKVNVVTKKPVDGSKPVQRPSVAQKKTGESLKTTTLNTL